MSHSKYWHVSDGNVSQKKGMWTSSQPQRNLSKFSAQTIDEEFFGTSPTWIEQFEWELSNKYGSYIIDGN